MIGNALNGLDKPFFNAVFGADVKIMYTLKSEDKENFCLNLTETFSARLKAEIIEEKISAFKIN